MGAPQVQGRPLEAYLEQLAATRARTLEVLRGFTDADLARLVGEGEPPRGMEPRSVLYTIDWIIWHIIDTRPRTSARSSCCAAWLPSLPRRFRTPPAPVR